MNGASALTRPMKRPIRMVLPPCRSKYDSTCLSRASVILKRGPCFSRKRRPSRLPMKKLVVSPSTADSQTIPIRGSRSIVPCPATTPAAMTIVSPGATSPTNAPVSRKAATATSAYVHAPSASATSSITFFGSGSVERTPLA